MKTENKNQQKVAVAGLRPRKRVEVVGPVGVSRFRMSPLDNHSVNQVFVTHDRFRAFLRSA